MDFSVNELDKKNRNKKYDLIQKAQYQKALELSKSFKKKYPQKAIYHIDEAVLIGDQPTNDPIKEALQKKKAAQLLKKFIKSESKMEEPHRTRFLNEYYWFSVQPQKQFQLGINTVKRGEPRGYYSQGVGASYYAHQLMKQGKAVEARKWAALSEKAWLQYFAKVGKSYYNAYCWYALALGLQCKFEKMYLAFAKAEKLSGQPSTYPEFYSFKNLIFEPLTRNSERSIKGRLPFLWYCYDESLRQELIKTRVTLQKGDAKEFFRQSFAVSKKYKNDLYGKIRHWALWGDLGQYFDDVTEAQFKRDAVSAFNDLKSSAFPNSFVDMVYHNEVFYHSQQFLSQYKWGVQTNKTYPGRGDFSMGVGASEHANQLLQLGKKNEAKKWAKLSVSAWKRRYKGPKELQKDYFYIQALFISGNKKLARELIFKVMSKNSDFENGVWARLLKRWGGYPA